MSRIMRFLDETLWAPTNSIYVEGKLRFWRDPTSYILKASSVTPTEPQTNLNFPQSFPKMPRNGPKMASKAQFNIQGDLPGPKLKTKCSPLSSTYDVERYMPQN